MPVVIALLTALAVFGASVVVVSTTQHAGSALDLEGVRAYHAAKGGLEWGMYHVLRTGFAGCTGVNSIDGKTLTYGGNLTGFRVTLTCTSSIHEEGTGNVTMFEIRANACNDTVCPAPGTPAPPPAFYVERELRVTVGSN